MADARPPRVLTFRVVTRLQNGETLRYQEALSLDGLDGEGIYKAGVDVLANAALAVSTAGLLMGVKAVTLYAGVAGPGEQPDLRPIGPWLREALFPEPKKRGRFPWRTR